MSTVLTSPAPRDLLAYLTNLGESSEELDYDLIINRVDEMVKKYLGAEYTDGGGEEGYPTEMQGVIALELTRYLLILAEIQSGQYMEEDTDEGIDQHLKEEEKRVITLQELDDLSEMTVDPLELMYSDSQTNPATVYGLVFTQLVMDLDELWEES